MGQPPLRDEDTHSIQRGETIRTLLMLLAPPAITWAAMLASHPEFATDSTALSILVLVTLLYLGVVVQGLRTLPPTVGET